MSIWIDWIYSYMNSFIEVSIEFLFFNKYLHPSMKSKYTILFIFLSSIIVNLPFSTLLKLLLFASLLLIYSTEILKINIKSAILYILLTIELMQLCYGVFNSLSTILSFFIYHINPLLFGQIFMIAGNLFSLALAILCYQIILKYIKYKKNIHNQYILMIIIPLLTIFVISGYIQFTFYGNVQTIEISPVILNKNHILMLIIQLLGIVSIFSIMYSYQKLTDSFFLNTKLSMLTQQTHFQDQYVKEAWVHYNNTKALRHDIKNHIMIIKGLLEKENISDAKKYIEKLDIAAANTSFSFHTNNPVLDILLENKMALANSKDIYMDSSLHIPSLCIVNDMDLCIIMANALDNAINACNQINANRKRYIHISSHRQEDFLLIKIKNSFDGNVHFKQGIGLSNIKWIAQKYNGTIDITTTDDTFCLNILLVISQQ